MNLIWILLTVENWLEPKVVQSQNELNPLTRQVLTANFFVESVEKFH